MKSKMDKLACGTISLNGSRQTGPTMATELRKRRTAAEAGIPEDIEPPKIDAGTPLIPPIDDEKKGKEGGLIRSMAAHCFEWERPVAKTNLLILLLFTVLSFASRFYRIQKGHFVVWDEAHFGKFASYYLKRTFYFDVHPPLGKMLVALGGYLAGYDGSFDFASGGDYAGKVPYIAMRMFVASFGALIVPLAYLTSIQLRFRSSTAILVASMTLLDNGFIGITRLILLDSMLLGFTAFTFCAYSWFRNLSNEPFTRKWKLALTLTGLGIGCVSSVKWVGFFVTALVGLMTIEELWSMLGDPSMSKKLFAKHFYNRAFGLIFVPITVYVISFMFHFQILNKSGPGDANMSSLFQAGLAGSDLSKSPVELAYGSIVTLKSNTYGGGLLHSHVQGYPEGSKQQQVTTYHHKDHNNLWIIVHPLTETFAQRDYSVDPIEPIKNGDIVRLVHNSTGRCLHSHRVAAPVNTKDYEVSGYGKIDHEDPNDLWQVDVVKETRSGDSILRALSTKFRLKHVATGCYLKSRNNQLPEWGFRQGEVSCDYTPELGARYLEWNVETHVNERLPPGDASQYKSRFMDDFKDCNVGMYITNNALVPDPELEPGALVSNAHEWFWMRRGIRMCSWADDRIKFYMLGNPTVWWTGSVAIITTLLLTVAYTLINQRKAHHLLPANYENFKYRVKMITGGWALTYLPFFVMGRVLYVHHYYPALIFSTLNVGLVIDHVLGNRSPLVRRSITTAMILIVLVTFIYFSPMCYGIEGPGKAFRGRRWLKSWNL